MTKKELQKINKLILESLGNFEQRLGKKIRQVPDKKFLDSRLRKLLEDIYSSWLPY